MNSSGGTSSSTFHQRREDIFKRLRENAKQCRSAYEGQRELASERDVVVAELCETLEEALTYGLRQQVTVALTAANLLQNMTEIMTGATSSNGSSATNDTTFWDFCQMHLTKHERERFESLKHVWTKTGRGRAFIRATLNENSLQRYLLTWLSDEEILRQYYTPWSLLLDSEVSRALPEIAGSLNKVVFALKIDTIEMNATERYVPPVREEPIIYAPTPRPSAPTSSKRKVNPIERPIASTEDVIAALKTTALSTSNNVQAAFEAYAQEEEAEKIIYDPIEPELEFLKKPLADFCPENHAFALPLTNGDRAAVSSADERAEEDEDTSSQYSKASSSAANNNCSVLEEKLRDMSEKYALLETRVAQLTRENRQLVRRLTQLFNESGIDPSSSLATNFLITIPYVQLLKAKRSAAYYVYEIHITMRHHLEHWTVLRRYREFYKLHQSLLKTHPHIANTVEFPPKKHFGNMNQVFVEERRQQLQIYLLNIIEALPQVELCKSKSALQKAFPFLRER